MRKILSILLCCSVVATRIPPVTGFWFFSCPHGNRNGRAGDVCSVFCQCRPPNTCLAGLQRCVAPAKHAEPCHATKPCGPGLSCHPGVQRCYHVPRRLHEPCVAGFGCGSGLTCEPGIQVCYHQLRQYNEPCAAGFPCAGGLSCQPGIQRCLNHPRRENERCSLGFECADGLECTLCAKPYLTCQMSRVPSNDEQFYRRPFNMVAFLVTHNAYSSGPRYAVWARNQRYSVRQQLLDGVRGLMLDIYPGWGEAEVTLCHETCFWGGATDLLDTLIVVRKFLENNPREVITIIFEDYLRNPTILKHVFDKAGVSRHVLDSSEWGNVYKNWPTLHEMRRLGRLVVFNNNGLKGFPYTEDNMWFYVRENRYGQPGLDTKTCVDRGESRLNADFSDNWSLVLVNWFGTATNPLNPCLNSFLKMKRKLATCAREFGQRANFVAVDYYESGEHGGAFKAVQWLNDQWKDLYNRHLKQVSGVKGPETRLNSLRYSDKLGSVFKSNYSKGVTLEEVYNDNGFRNSLGFLIPSNITKLISSPKEKDYRNVKGTNNTLGFVESYRDQIGDRDNISEVPKASTSFPDSSTNDYVSGSGEKEHKLNRISLMAALNEMIGTNQVEDTVEELGRNVSSSEHTMKLLRNNSQPHFGTVVARPAEATKKRNVSVNHIVSQNGQGYSNKTQYLTEIIDQI